MSLTDPPAADEVEVTLFGRGVGESIVVHVGDGSWLIVDSFMSEHSSTNSETGRASRLPVARWYLDRMGVKPDDVAEIVITHLHQDHYRGVDRLHDYYTRARLSVTSALTADVMRQAYGDAATRQVCAPMPTTMKRAQARRCDGAFANGLRRLAVGSTLWFGTDVVVRALSPMDAAVTASMVDIAAAMESGREATRSTLRNQNWCSVVLHVHTPAGDALLCADLETDPPEFGWAAVLDETSHAILESASLVKVGHHGSHTAEHPPMWERMVDGGADMTVAPFTGGTQLPTTADWLRLCARGPLHQASPSVTTYTNTVGHVTQCEGPTGLIQARRRIGDDRWRVQYEGKAFHVNPVLVAMG